MDDPDVRASAWSLDGRAFSFEAPLASLALQVGGYVALDHDGRSTLGQVHGLELARRGVVGGDGRVLDHGETPFHDARIDPAPDDVVGAWLEQTRPLRAALPFGELLLASAVPF